MFCNQCGKQLPDDAMFCPGCGAKQDPLVKAAAAAQSAAPAPAAAPTPAAPAPTQTPTPAAVPTPAASIPTAVPGAVPAQKTKKEKKGFPFKVVVPLAGIVVLVVVLAVVVMSIGGRGVKADRYSEKGMIGYYYLDSHIAFFNLQGETCELDDVSAYGLTMAENADMSVVAYTVWNEKSDDYDLYYITSDLEPVLVEEDVHYSVRISYDGAYIAYLTDVKNDTSGDLYLYSIKDNKSTLIDSEVYPYLICMSPGGKAVAYLREFEDMDDNELYVGGIKIDSQKVDKDGSVPVAIRDNGKTLYYVTDNDKLYLYNGKDSVKLASDVDRDFYFNRDASQVLYTKGGKTYFYELKMEEPVKVASAEIYDIVLPMDVVRYDGNNYYTEFVGLNDLKGCVMETDSGLYWLNSKGTDTVKIASTYTYQISADGKSIIYQNGKTIYKISKFSEDMEPKVVYNEEYVDRFVASADLSKVYVIIDDELFYVKSEKKTERITNDLSDYGYRTVAYNDSMDKIFFIERDTLYYAGTTAKSKTEVADEVDGVDSFPAGVLYTITEDDETTCYYMKNKEAIELYTY
ncbi:MAG: zinc ribbon domain-containing protein [Lachnospiraceae bacterium]|nr:zinc ribbon domain-containing protein [Lachnospiraceae bacterium]